MLIHCIFNSFQKSLSLILSICRPWKANSSSLNTGTLSVLCAGSWGYGPEAPAAFFWPPPITVNSRSNDPSLASSSTRASAAYGYCYWGASCFVDFYFIEPFSDAFLPIPAICSSKAASRAYASPSGAPIASLKSDSALSASAIYFSRFLYSSCILESSIGMDSLMFLFLAFFFFFFFGRIMAELSFRELWGSLALTISAPMYCMEPATDDGACDSLTSWSFLKILLRGLSLLALAVIPAFLFWELSTLSFRPLNGSMGSLGFLVGFTSMEACKLPALIFYREPIALPILFLWFLLLLTDSSVTTSSCWSASMSNLNLSTVSFATCFSNFFFLFSKEPFLELFDLSGDSILLLLWLPSLSRVRSVAPSFCYCPTPIDGSTLPLFSLWWPFDVSIEVFLSELPAVLDFLE